MAINGPNFFPPLGPATSQPAFEPKGWDRCLLADQVLPARCRILDAFCALKIDPKSSSGSDGSNPTFRGMDAQPLRMEITTFNDADREALASMIGSYVPQPGVKPKAVSIDHPSLRIIRVYAVLIVGAGALIPEPGTTKAKMVLRMQHWLPGRRKNATTTPKGAPTRKVKNNRPQNPAPTDQPGFAVPPALQP